MIEKKMSTKKYTADESGSTDNAREGRDESNTPKYGKKRMRKKYGCLL